MAHPCGGLARECQRACAPQGGDFDPVVTGALAIGWGRRARYSQLAHTWRLASSIISVASRIVGRKVPDVAFFAMLRKIQSLDLVFLFDS